MMKKKKVDISKLLMQTDKISKEIFKEKNIEMCSVATFCT